MAAAYRGKCWTLPSSLEHATKVTISLSDARHRSLNLEGCDLSWNQTGSSADWHTDLSCK